MAKKIKVKHAQTEEEKKAEEQAKADEAAKAAAGIQDEFQAKGFELVEWMQERQGFVLGVIGLIIAGGLAYGIFTVVQSSRNTNASAALGEALEIYEAEITETEPEPDKDGKKKPTFKDAASRAKAAREKLQGVVSAHGGTGAAAVASLYVGHASLAVGEHDAAAKAYQEFLDDSSRNDPLRFAGLSGLATALDAKGDRKGAIARLEELVGLPDKVDEDAALLELGRLHQEDGDVEAARAALTRIGKDFPESTLKSRAEERLSQLPTAPPSATPPATPPAATPPGTPPAAPPAPGTTAAAPPAAPAAAPAATP